ncbi:MAG: cation transport protein ChaC [Limisphaerales bacterium]|jgi:cation transport protein ChaC
MAYLVEAETVTRVFEQLDHREKNGYERIEVQLQTADGQSETGLVYIAPTNNFAYLGDAPLQNIAAQIARSEGPSGKNCDYLFELAIALREIGADDAHVFALESAVRNILQERGR